MSSAPVPRPGSKAVPRVALVQLDTSTTETLTRAFAQCGIHTVPVSENFAKRLGLEQFQGCVVRLDDHASAVLEAVRSSRSEAGPVDYDLRGLTVLPGWIDAHAYVYVNTRLPQLR